MTASRCPCGQPSPDAAICRACTRTLRKALETALTIAADLDIAIARQSVFATASGSHGKGSVAPLPYDERAAEAAWILRDTIAAWHRAAIGPIEDPQLAAMASALIQAMATIRQRPDAAECADEITTAVHRATRAIDRPPSRVYAGPCGQCGTHLYASPGATMVTCRQHEPPWAAPVADRWEWMLGQVADHLLHAAGAVHVLSLLGLHVTAVQVTRWVQAGRLTARGIDRMRRPTYRLGDLTVLAMTMRRAG